MEGSSGKLKSGEHFSSSMLCLDERHTPSQILEPFAPICVVYTLLQDKIKAISVLMSILALVICH